MGWFKWTGCGNINLHDWKKTLLYFDILCLEVLFLPPKMTFHCMNVDLYPQKSMWANLYLLYSKSVTRFWVKIIQLLKTSQKITQLLQMSYNIQMTTSNYVVRSICKLWDSLGLKNCAILCHFPVKGVLWRTTESRFVELIFDQIPDLLDNLLPKINPSNRTLSCKRSKR